MNLEVLAGPTLRIDVSSSSHDRSLPLSGTVGGYKGGSGGSGNGIGRLPKFRVEDSSYSSSSSIGSREDCETKSSGNDTGKNDDEEVQSRFGAGLGSLEDSLPIKRSLSNHFSGKSKSFADLSQVSQMEELMKPENPFNKRRRLLVASKMMGKQPSFYCWSNPKSMRRLNEDKDEDEEYQYEKARADTFASPSRSPSLSSSSSSLEEKKDGEKDQRQQQERRMFESYLRLRSFKKSGCLSLTDLQEHEVDQ